jgi:hypothetical protein
MQGTITIFRFDIEMGAKYVTCERPPRMLLPVLKMLLPNRNFSEKLGKPLSATLSALQASNCESLLLCDLVSP